MTLPRGNEATVKREKIEGYALSPNHPEGKHKARIFKSALGMDDSCVDDLIAELRRAATHGDAELGRVDRFGQRYIIDFELAGPSGKTAIVRSAWIVRGEDPPDLVTCYIM